MTCLIAGCPRQRNVGKKFKRRYCKMHATRITKTGVAGPITPLIGKRGEGYTHSDGYKAFVKQGKEVLEHRDVWQKKFGVIPKGFVIHHRNGDKLDNRIENLECMLIADHVSLHKKGVRLATN